MCVLLTNLGNLAELGETMEKMRADVVVVEATERERQCVCVCVLGEETEEEKGI